MKIENEIISSVIAAVKELYGQDVPEKMVALQKTKSNFEGNLTLVVFPFIKMSKKKPEDTAQEIGEYLKKNCCNVIADFNVVKGFLNLSIAPAAWVGLLNDIHADEKFGEKPVTEQSPLVMIEYSSPNTNKPLHLGHVRNNLLGWSLAQIMEANGNKVIKTNIVNDRGIHICKSMLAWLKWGNGETPETSGKKGDHLIGDYYVAFDKHYREEIAELKAQYMKEGMDEEAATEKAKAEAPLIKEAHEMLVKWENNDPEVRALWEKMNNWDYYVAHVNPTVVEMKLESCPIDQILRASKRMTPVDSNRIEYYSIGQRPIKTKLTEKVNKTTNGGSVTACVMTASFTLRAICFLWTSPSATTMETRSLFSTHWLTRLLPLRAFSVTKQNLISSLPV